MTVMRWTGVALCVALAACGKAEDKKPAGMPEGYARVNQAFGVRMAGLEEIEGSQRAPVVEFRAGGDYAMYPLTTDCEGNFRRGAGLVFAPDGTVREQVKEQAIETLTSSPQFVPVVDRICTPSRTAFAAIKDDATHRRTRFGMLEITGDRGSQSVMLKRGRVASGSLLAFAGLYRVADTDLVLVHEQDLGTSCPGGEYSVLTVTSAGASPSHAFGTCVEGEPEVRVVDGVLQVTLPGAEGPASFRVANGEVQGDGADAATVDTGEGLDSTTDAYAAADATSAAADAAAAAADAAASAVRDARRESPDRLAQQWVTTCESSSRRVTTPAGSVVGLSADEARRYCGCVWQRAPNEASAIVRGAGLGAQPVSSLIPRAHAACLQDMM